MRRNINEKVLRSLKPPAKGRLVVRDRTLPGLRIRVTPRGVKTWSVVYKMAGEKTSKITGLPRTGSQKRITLGRYPAMGLSEARDKAKEILDQVSRGNDPRPERRERKTNTLASVGRRLNTTEKAARVLERHVYPVLGHRPISDIRRADIHELLDDIVDDGLVGTARECRKHLSRLFNMAVDRELVSGNPASRMDRPEKASNKEAGRALTDAELKSIWAATFELGYPPGPFYRLLILTGQRRADWGDAAWPEIDFQERLLDIPGRRYKSNRDQVVPLVGPAWEIVEGLPRQAGDYLFSNREGHVPISYFARAKARLDELAPVAKYRVHDFRVTCKTRLVKLGAGQDTTEAILGHGKRGLDQIYNKYRYASEKREALAAYAAHIMEVVK